METPEVLLKKARMIGERMEIDVVPDPTAEGFRQWKSDLLTDFGCAIDNFLDENHIETLSDEMLAAMKMGFVHLVKTQPYVEAPLQPMEPTPRETELRIVDEVFAELKLVPHYCTH